MKARIHVKCVCVSVAIIFNLEEDQKNTFKKSPISKQSTVHLAPLRKATHHLTLLRKIRKSEREEKKVIAF